MAVFLYENVYLTIVRTTVCQCFIVFTLKYPVFEGNLRYRNLSIYT